MVCLRTHQQSQAVACFSETSSQTLHKKQKQKQRWSRNIQSEAMLLRIGKLNCQRSLVALTSLTTIPFMATRACLKELLHEEREWKMLCWEHVSSLMTFYPDMRMMLSGWSEKNVFQDLVKQRTWFPEATSSEIWWLVRFKKKKIRTCISFSAAGWDTEHAAYRSMQYLSESAACRQAPMHSSYRNNALGELPIIPIGINCHIIITLQWIECSKDCCPMEEGCSHILHSLKKTNTLKPCFM